MPDACCQGSKVNGGRGSSCPPSPGQCDDDDDENTGHCRGGEEAEWQGNGSCDGANDELRAQPVDCSVNSCHTAAAVASLDHCYLTATSYPPSAVDQLPSPTPDVPVPTGLEDTDDVASVDDTAAGESMSAAGTAGRSSQSRNISIFVVPQPMPSCGLRWRARIIRADATSTPDELSCAAGGEPATASESLSSGAQGSSSQAAAASWVPLSADAGRVTKSTTVNDFQLNKE